MGKPVTRLLRVALCCLGVVLCGRARATAPGETSQVTCTVRVIHLLSTGTGTDSDRGAPPGDPPRFIDPRLAPLSQLRKPPFSAWRTIQLLEQHDVTLQKGVPAAFTVPGDHQGAQD
jgi:hypothetical protein